MSVSLRYCSRSGSVGARATGLAVTNWPKLAGVRLCDTLGTIRPLFRSRRSASHGYRQRGNNPPRDRLKPGGPRTNWPGPPGKAQGKRHGSGPRWIYRLCSPPRFETVSRAGCGTVKPPMHCCTMVTKPTLQFLAPRTCAGIAIPALQPYTNHLTS
jgi:hypothetical protein